MSYKYYDEHAIEYLQSSFSADMSETINRFLKYLPTKGSILDAGSGTGRDTKKFMELGYNVKAFDASIEMVNLSSKFTGINTRHLKFEDLDYKNEFDGIWACASLLHVERENLTQVFVSLKSALKKDGIIYCSFKSRNDDFIKDGRNFTCFTKEKLIEYFEKLEQFNIIDIWESEDVRENRSKEFWINCLLR